MYSSTPSPFIICLTLPSLHSPCCFCSLTLCFAFFSPTYRGSSSALSSSLGWSVNGCWQTPSRQKSQSPSLDCFLKHLLSRILLYKILLYNKTSETRRSPSQSHRNLLIVGFTYTAAHRCISFVINQIWNPFQLVVWMNKEIMTLSSEARLS